MLTFTLFLMLTVNGGPICERDIYRFPFPAAECERRWKASRDHVEHMRSNQPWECEWIDEATHLRDCWDQLDNARRYFLTSPVSGSATWERGGVIVTEEVARDIAEREPKAATPAK